MAGNKTPERRATGVHEIVITDGNGDKEVSYQINVRKVRAIAAAILAVGGVITMIGGGIAAGLKLGVRTEVQGAIKKECDPPDGMIYKSIKHTAEEFIEEVQGVIQDDLDVLDGRMEDMEKGQVAIVGSIDGLKAQSERNVEEIKLLLRRAIAESP